MTDQERITDFIHPYLDELYGIYHKGRTDKDCESGECEWDKVVGVMYEAIKKARGEVSRGVLKDSHELLTQQKQEILDEVIGMIEDMPGRWNDLYADMKKEAESLQKVVTKIKRMRKEL